MKKRIHYPNKTEWKVVEMKIFFKNGEGELDITDYKEELIEFIEEIVENNNIENTKGIV
ncbi:hypothetical protein [Bacillus sp. XF8]|uniref:hypothetical protein n=1 Tax=Bacillus sp. XF8 TaxID=2819289 RepID=UPI001AA05D50|nr:hypothetical protein [Bacillus sp. XF8]MBO1583176.1 hypothetical protein [Bacillus sp. XF8]